jgi:hypothetical protein
MLRLIALLITLVLSLFSFTALAAPPAQTPSIEASVDIDRVTVGDRIGLTVTVRHAADTRIEAPRSASLLGDLEVIEASPAQETTRPDSSKETRLHYVVVAFRTGALQLVPPSITLIADNDATQALTGSAIPIQVASVLPDDQPVTDIMDLKPQLLLPGEGGASSVPIFIGLGAAAAILLAAAILIRRLRRRQPALVIEKTAVTPEQRAREELDRIVEMDLVSQGRYKEYYGRIGNCIRRYITERYGFAAVALTTGELEAQMVRLGLNRWQARLAGGLLSECDEVVYARYVPALPRTEATLTMAYEITEMGAPREPEPLAQGASGQSR